MTTSLSIVIPTLGRASLRSTLHSVKQQLAWCDQVIVVADPSGDVDQAVQILNRVAGADRRWVYAEAESDGAGVGSAQRTIGMSLATGTHLAFVDDDDTHTRDALELMRAHASDRPVIFRMDDRGLHHGRLWRDPILSYGNVGTPMFLVPNRPEQLGRWDAHTQDGHGADYTFITGCVTSMGAPVWREETVCHVGQIPSQVVA